MITASFPSASVWQAAKYRLAGTESIDPSDAMRIRLILRMVEVCTGDITLDDSDFALVFGRPANEPGFRESDAQQ